MDLLLLIIRVLLFNKRLAIVTTWSQLTAMKSFCSLLSNTYGLVAIQSVACSNSCPIVVPIHHTVRAINPHFKYGKESCLRCLFSYGVTRTQRSNMLRYDSWSTGWSESITSPVVELLVAITMLIGPLVGAGGGGAYASPVFFSLIVI